MKLLALDLGDRWIGTATSDPLGITCKPFKTIELHELNSFLTLTLLQERISKVIVGLPTTFGGKESAQTAKIIALKEELATRFGTVNNQTITWILWDERLSSKRAHDLSPRGSTTPEAKKKSHSIAAAFILQTYLDNQAFLNQ